MWFEILAHVLPTNTLHSRQEPDGESSNADVLGASLESVPRRTCPMLKTH